MPTPTANKGTPKKRKISPRTEALPKLPEPRQNQPPKSMPRWLPTPKLPSMPSKPSTSQLKTPEGPSEPLEQSTSHQQPPIPTPNPVPLNQVRSSSHILDIVQYSVPSKPSTLTDLTEKCTKKQEIQSKSPPKEKSHPQTEVKKLLPPKYFPSLKERTFAPQSLATVSNPAGAANLPAQIHPSSTNPFAAVTLAIDSPAHPQRPSARISFEITAGATNPSVQIHLSSTNPFAAVTLAIDSPAHPQPPSAPASSKISAGADNPLDVVTPTTYPPAHPEKSNTPGSLDTPGGAVNSPVPVHPPSPNPSAAISTTPPHVTGPQTSNADASLQNADAPGRDQKKERQRRRNRIKKRNRRLKRQLLRNLSL